MKVRYVLEATRQDCRLRQMNWPEAPRTMIVSDKSRETLSGALTLL